MMAQHRTSIVHINANQQPAIAHIEWRLSILVERSLDIFPHNPKGGEGS
jgi:hypothetical protein